MLLKPLWNIVRYITLLIAIAIALLHLPPLQHYLFQKGVAHIYQRTNYRIAYKDIQLSWLQTITLKELSVVDPQQQPIFSLQTCKGRINLLYLLFMPSKVLTTLYLKGGEYNISKKFENQTNIELFYNQVVALFLPTAKSDQRHNLSIKKLTLDGCNLYYDPLTNLPPITIKNIELTIKNFVSSTAGQFGNITQCSYDETSLTSLILKNFKAKFALKSNHITLQRCQLTTKNSCIKGDFQIKNKNKLPLHKDPANNLLLCALYSTKIASKELALYSDRIKSSDVQYELNGLLTLTPTTLAWQDFTLALAGSKDYIKSSGRYDMFQQHGHITINKGMLHKHNLYTCLNLPNATCLKALEHIICRDVTLVGNSQQMHLTGHIATNIGSIEADIEIEPSGKDNAIPTYHGQIALEQIIVNALWPSLPISALSGIIKLSGSGNKSIETKFHGRAEISELKTTTYAYTYRDISLTYNMSQGIVAFEVASKDPNATLALIGKYHMTGQQHLKASGNIEVLQLAPLGLSKIPLTLHTKCSFSLPHLISKRLAGRVVLQQCIIKQSTREIAISSIEIDLSQNQGKKQLLTLKSPLINCSFTGSYTIESLRTHTHYLLKKIYTSLDSTPTPILPKLQIAYTIECKNIYKILSWFSKELYISPSTTLTGHLSYDQDYHFILDLPTEATIRWRNAQLEKTKISIEGNNITNKNKRSIQLYISSQKQTWFKDYQTDNWLLELIVDKNRFTLSNGLAMHQYNSHLSLACTGQLHSSELSIDLLPTQLTINDKIWAFQPTTPCLISKEKLIIGEIYITLENQSIIIGGVLSKSYTKNPLHCLIKNLALSYPSMDHKEVLRGTMDAKFIVQTSVDRYMAKGSCSFAEVSINDYNVGRLTADVDWNGGDHALHLKGLLQKGKQTLLDFKGIYKPIQGESSKDSLSMHVRCKDFNLYALNPLVAPGFSALAGKVNGYIGLTGSPSKPILKGNASITQGQIKINYLNTLYKVSSKIHAESNILYLDKLDLQDHDKGHAHLTGQVTLAEGFPFHLSGNTVQLHLLNNDVTQQEAFYGTLYATGKLQIEGSTRNLTIHAKAKTDQGKCTIVLNNKENIDDTTQLVRFIYPPLTTDKGIAQENNSKPPKDRLNLFLILDLNILPNTNPIILFGAHNSQDMLEGNGNGNLHIEVGTNRKPYVLGSYTFQQGNCTISVHQLVPKTFTINSNSHVTFNGYPQEGNAYLEACYKQMVSITDFCPNSLDKRPIPVEITLAAHGTLMHPHISYGLHFPATTLDLSLHTALEACKARALLDKHYLSKQILSILIAKRIYNDAAIDGWDVLSTNINDLLSEQLQSWTSNRIQNLEIETDLGINQWHKSYHFLWIPKIKVSYLLLDRRLKLSSTIGRYSNLINDWEIAYKFLKINNMGVKIYQQPLEGNPINKGFSGFSFTYTKEF